MKYQSIAFAVALTAIGGAHAQQQTFGRDSVYALSGNPGTPAAAPLVAGPTDRSGRDSVYATQTRSISSNPVSANAGSLQQNGRGSVFALGSLNAPAASETKVVSSGRGHGG